MQIDRYPELLTLSNAASHCPIPSAKKMEVRSRVEKMVEFALPMSPMYFVISFMLYLSMCEWLFNSLKSWTILNQWPCFFGTQKRGEL
jgi:hypothetical protein